MIDFFSGDFWFDQLSYEIDDQSNSIARFEKIVTTTEN